MMCSDNLQLGYIVHTDRLRSLVDKASAYGAGGRRFDPGLSRFGVVLIWPVGEPPAS